MLVKIQFTASLADEATRNVSQFQFPIYPFSFYISYPPPPSPTSLSLSFVPIVCAIIQIYAKYNTLLATFWHPLDSALSIRLVELICFDCPLDPAPLTSFPPCYPHVYTAICQINCQLKVPSHNIFPSPSLSLSFFPSSSSFFSPWQCVRFVVHAWLRRSLLRAAIATAFCRVGKEKFSVRVIKL